MAVLQRLEALKFEGSQFVNNINSEIMTSISESHKCNKIGDG